MRTHPHGPRLALLLLLTLLQLTGWQALSAVPLSPQTVIDHMLNKSLKVEAVMKTHAVAETLLTQANGVYDPIMSTDLGYTLNAMENLAGLNNLEDRTLNLQIRLGKTFAYGTTATLSYLRTHQDSLLGTYSQSLRDPILFQHVAGVQIEQSLWNNRWGSLTRSQIARARAELQKSDFDHQEEIENLALEALRLYWNTYVAKESFKAALGARDRYTYLAQIVKRKQRVSLISPGEYHQVLAEAAAQEQNVKESSAQYLRLSSELFEMMLGEEGHIKNVEDIDFQIKDLIPPLPTAPPVETTQLRLFRRAQLESEQAQREYDEARMANSPILNLVTRAQLAGMDRQDSEAVAEMVSGQRPEYYVGLKFQTTLGGAQTSGKTQEKYLRWQVAQNALRQGGLSLTRQEQHLAQLVKSTYQIAELASQTYEHRKKVVAEQELGFMQGRFALSQLTRSFVELFQSETRRIRAIGDYHLALHEWAANRDELFGGNHDDKSTTP